jgi:hypothetical protein
MIKYRAYARSFQLLSKAFGTIRRQILDFPAPQIPGKYFEASQPLSAALSTAFAIPLAMETWTPTRTMF